MAATTSSPCLPTKPRWQFSVRSVLLLTGIIAVVLACWPFREEPWSVHAGFAVLTVAVLLTAALIPQAWRVAGDRWRQQAEADDLSPVTNEVVALWFGIASIATYGPLWLMLFFARVESTDPRIEGAVAACIVSAIGLSPLLVLAISLSFLTFWGTSKNPPLFVIRVVGLLANVILLGLTLGAIVAIH